jgi:putative acetyltransferase
MEIVVDDLSGPEIAAFLEEHIEEMKSVSPPESKHALDLDGLRVPEVTFWTMLEDGAVVGCGAIKLLGDGEAEIKSMRVAESHRGRGLASAILRHILAECRRLGIARVYLETGSFDFFAPARRLYLRHGFELCPPFADYEEDPNSVFMTRTLP